MPEMPEDMEQVRIAVQEIKHSGVRVSLKAPKWMSAKSQKGV